MTKDQGHLQQQAAYLIPLRDGEDQMPDEEQTENRLLSVEEMMQALIDRSNGRGLSKKAEESLRHWEDQKAIVDVVRPLDERRSIEYELIAAHEAKDWDRIGQITDMLALSPVNLKPVIIELITWMVTVSKEPKLELPLSQFLSRLWLVMDIEGSAGDNSAIHTETIRADDEPDED